MLNPFNKKREPEAEDAASMASDHEAQPEALAEEHAPSADSPKAEDPTPGSGDSQVREELVAAEDGGSPAEETDAAEAPEDAPVGRKCDKSDEGAGRPAAKGAGKSASKSKPSGLKSLWQGSSVWRAAVLGTLIYLAFVNVGYFLFMKPIGERLSGMQERAAVLHDFAVVQESSAAIADFTSGLMSGDQRMTVMAEVNEMAKDSGVRVMGDPELLLPRTVSESINEYPIRLRVKGTYNEIGGFLSLLESSARFMQVEHVEIQSDIESRDRESEATMLLAIASWEG